MSRKNGVLLTVGLIAIASGAVVVSFKRKGQTETTSVVFSHHITELGNVSFVQPPGGIEEWEGGKILKTHAYIVTPGKTPVYAPVGSELYQGTNYLEDGIEQYSLFFSVNRSVHYYIDHILEPSTRVKVVFASPPIANARPQPLRKTVNFEPGELIGYADGSRGTIHFDFGVFDTQRRNSLEDLEAMPGMKLFEREYQTLCPFDFYPEDMAAEYYKLFDTIRTEDEIPTRFCN